MSESGGHQQAKDYTLEAARSNEAVRQYLNGLYSRLNEEYGDDWYDMEIGAILMDDMREYAIDVDYDYRLFPDEDDTDDDTNEDESGLAADEAEEIVEGAAPWRE